MNKSWLQMSTKRKNKYGNHKTEVDGYKFDSRKEAEKYTELRSDPSIKNFVVHPKFELVPKTFKDGVWNRAVYYIADFEVWYMDGRHEIIDIKPWSRNTGDYFLTEVFKLKQKIFDWKYPELTLVIE